MHQVMECWLRAVELWNSCSSNSELRPTYTPKPVRRMKGTQHLAKIFSQSRNLLTHPIGNAAANAIQKVNSKVGKRSSSAHFKWLLLPTTSRNLTPLYRLLCSFNMFRLMKCELKFFKNLEIYPITRSPTNFPSRKFATLLQMGDTDGCV